MSYPVNKTTIEGNIFFFIKTSNNPKRCMLLLGTFYQFAAPPINLFWINSV